jgi:hypothetical protein
MQSFNDVLKRAAIDTIDNLGQFVYIRGLKFEAIFRDEEFETDAGFQRIVSIPITAIESSKVRKGDPVIVGNTAYSLKSIPETSDQLIEIELKRA